MTQAERLIDALRRLGYSPSQYAVGQTSDALTLTWASGNGPTIDEILAMPLPPVVTCWQPSEFRDRFAPDELIAIHRKANIDDAICLLEINLFTAATIRSDSAAVKDGMKLLVARKVLTQERCDEIIRGA